MKTDSVKRQKANLNTARHPRNFRFGIPYICGLPDDECKIIMRLVDEIAKTVGYY